MRFFDILLSKDELGSDKMAKKCKKLEEIKEMFKDNSIDIDLLSTDELKEILGIFKLQKDNREQYKVKHKMEDIVMITFLALMSNANEWTEIYNFAIHHEKWLKKFLKLKNGIPSHDTIQRVISILNPQELYNDCLKYIIKKMDDLTSKEENEKDVLSMDGKTSNGSSRSKLTTEEIKPVNTMSIYSHNYGISLVQDYIDEKSNEIPMGPELIKKLKLNNCILTADALNTQKDTVEAIIKAKGDYVLALKKNQKRFYEDVKDYFEDKVNIKKIEDYFEETEKSHSKIITRKYYMTNDIKWLHGHKKWKNLKSIGVEFKTIESIQTGEIIKENRYFIISFENNVHDFSDAVRKHWGVENNLHAPLDIIFLEDKNKTLEKNGAKNLGILRRIVLNILKFIQCYYNKMSLKLIRFDISMDVETGLEKVFKILNTEQIKSLLKENA